VAAACCTQQMYVCGVHMHLFFGSSPVASHSQPVDFLENLNLKLKVQFLKILVFVERKITIELSWHRDSLLFFGKKARCILLIF
jgi:hypothetical protein